MAVMNLRSARMQEGDVQIDRTSRWGNPFRIGPDGTRADVVRKHAVWLATQMELDEVSLEDLAELHGKDLYCWCAPLACHGETLETAAGLAVAELASMDRYGP